MNRKNKNKILEGYKTLKMYDYKKNCKAYLDIVLPFLKYS